MLVAASVSDGARALLTAIASRSIAAISFEPEPERPDMMSPNFTPTDEALPIVASIRWNPAAPSFIKIMAAFMP